MYLGLLPLGGYVKIAGMVDESLDTETMNSEPEPWEFRFQAGMAANRGDYGRRHL